MTGEVGCCIVTGASRGIGQAIAHRLTQRGFSVVGIARSRPDDWPGADFIETDLSSEQGVGSATARFGEFAPIWAMVNVAGKAAVQRLEKLSSDTMMDLYWLNAVVPALLTQAACRYMPGPGRVLNISSVMALGAAGRSAYGASKAALSSLTKTWSLELAPRRITVNAIAPGPIEIGMFRVLNPLGSIGEAELLRNIPIGHFGAIDEVTDMAAYIVDPTNGYLTGQVVYLDGGWSVGRV